MLLFRYQFQKSLCDKWQWERLEKTEKGTCEHLKWTIRYKKVPLGGEGGKEGWARGFRYLLRFRFLGLDSLSFFLSFRFGSASSESSIVTTSWGGFFSTAGTDAGVFWGAAGGSCAALVVAVTAAAGGTGSSSSTSLMYAPRHAWRAAWKRGKEIWITVL